MGRPVLEDPMLCLAAGIDPVTKRPIKLKSLKAIKGDIKMFLRLIDEQDAVGRYVWHNIPCSLTSQEIERMLYYKGQLCFFYDKDINEFILSPYTLSGTIDYYGRFNTIRPIPFALGTEEKTNKPLNDLLSNKRLNVIYGIVTEEPTEDMIKNSCVLLHDYSKQLSQTIIPRVQVNDPLLEVMAECVPFMRTSLLLSTGVKGIRVNDADQQESVEEGSKSLETAALSGQPYVPIIGQIEFQELADGAPAKAEEYMLAMQSLDNLRLSGYGIDNGGLFEKKAHELQSEADVNGGPVGLVLQDGLSIRQNFCNIVNSLYGTGMWVEPAQNIMGMDTDGDGAIFDDNSDGQNTGIEEPVENGGNEDE